MASKNWLIKTEKTADADSAIVLRAKRLPRFSEGDTVIFADLWGKTFRAQSRVTGVRQAAELSFADVRAVELRVASSQQLSSSADLETLRYSLLFVRDPARPMAYLRREFRSLSHEDVETIRLGVPFLARSAYYKLLGALPSSLRLVFEASCRGGGNATHATSSYAELLTLLVDFLRARVLSVGESLRTLSAISRSQSWVTTQGRRVTSHVFTNDSEEYSPRLSMSDDIDEQAKAFERLSEATRPSVVALGELGELSIGEPDIFDATLAELKDGERSSYEHRFERIFRREIERF